MNTNKTPYKKPFTHNNNNGKRKRKREFIDFATLDTKGLVSLTREWEKNARIFEAQLQSYMRNPHANEEKVERLWEVGKKLWRRVQILERWKIHNKKK